MITDISGQATQVDPITFNNETKIIHQTINGKYRVCIERSAVKGVDGFKVEANDDNGESALTQAEILYHRVISMTTPAIQSEIKEK